VKPSFAIPNLGLQVVNPSLKGLAVGTPDRFHAGIIRGSGTRSCTDGRRGIAQFELGTLIKYRQLNPTRDVGKAGILFGTAKQKGPLPTDGVALFLLQ
jgi:hypothetical protein